MRTISCLIPLHKSRAFLDLIEANIEAQLELDSEIIISDRHSLDDTAHILRQRYLAEPRVKVHAVSDGADWVDNINWLLQVACGKYVRIVPHDDTATTASTAILLSALESFPEAVLSYGKVRACGLDGVAMPEKDQSNSREQPMSCEWSIDNALSLFWTGRYAGAFKGVIRAELIKANQVYIRKTPTLVNSERAWLFALALLGPFVFAPDSIFIKRYHAGSVHAAWRRSPQTVGDAAEVMESYCNDFIADSALRERVKFNLRVNARQLAAWLAQAEGPRPPYLPLGLDAN